MNRSKKHIDFLKRQIIKQRKWIEECETNGISYSNPERGEAIRQADMDALRKLETELADIESAIRADAPPAETFTELQKYCKNVEASGGGWNPVYANVIDKTGTKVGHIVASYPPYNSWTFYPAGDFRIAGSREYDLQRKQAEQRANGKRFHREVHARPLESIVPKWVGSFTLAGIDDYVSMRKADEAERKAKAEADEKTKTLTGELEVITTIGELARVIRNAHERHTDHAPINYIADELAIVLNLRNPHNFKTLCNPHRHGA